MWRNYLTVGLRALAKHRSYAAINIVGLALGIAACLLILTFVRYETSYDSWLGDAADAYQFQTIYKATPQGGEPFESQQTAYTAGQVLKKDFPQVEQVVFLSSEAAVIQRDGAPVLPERPYVTDGALFRVLQVPFVRGNPVTALDHPHDVVLSETEARKLFGSADPINQTITAIVHGATETYRVTGVFRDLPRNSHLNMTMVIRMDPPTFYRTQPDMLTSWSWQTGALYVRLKPGTDPATITAQLAAWKKRNIPDDVGATPRTNPGDYQDYRLVNVADVHLAKAQGQGRPQGDRQTIATFSIVALLILGMACMNFTNLATARATQRAREVALRKVLGASRGQLIVQFLAESVLVAGIAMLVALALAELALPSLDAFLQADMVFRYLGRDGVLLPSLLLTLIVGLAGGVYPALYLSRFEPARILKANKSAADAEGSGRLRTILVVTQFAVSIGLIACTAVIWAQTAYARHADAGYHRDGLLQIARIDDPQVDRQMRAMLEQLRAIPGVGEAARTSQGIAPGNNSTTAVNRPGAQPVMLGIYGVDDHLFATLGVPLLAGRNFSAAIPTDDSTTPTPPDLNVERSFVARGTNVVLSRLAAQRLGWNDPAQAIGQRVQLIMVSPELGPITATVVGVVGDVRYRTARMPVQPILYFYQTTGFNRLLVRIVGDPVATKAKVDALWKRMLPQYPLDERYAADIVHDLYNADARRATLFGGFAVLAAVIGCLGLFGLAAFTAERRTKEIGIRKVLGARTRDIVRLLVWQFSRPVLIANLIAWPIAWWAMRDWLNGFDARVALTPVPFLAAGALALAIAVATIAGHAYRIAQTSPIRALRYE